MAISPVLLNKLPFDAEQKLTIEFTYSGSQIFAYKIIVKDNATQTVAYDSGIVAWMDNSAIVPANTLTNGNTQNFNLYVYEANPSTTEDLTPYTSAISNTIILIALKTPQFSLSNVLEGMIIRNSHFTTSIIYSQENGELLDEYTVYVYGADQTTIVYSSGVLYADAQDILIPELIDDTTYYIRATGSTVNGVALDTGKIVFSCDYLKPDLFLKFRADNIEDEGYVKLSSNFVIVEGRTDSESLIYVDNEKISLLNGESVIFDNGFEVQNFVCDIVVSDIPDYATISTFRMNAVTTELSWRCGYFEESEELLYYVELIAYQQIGSEKLSYIQMSNRIPALMDGQQLFIWLKHVNGLFDLKIEALSNASATNIDEITPEINEGGEA